MVALQLLLDKGQEEDWFASSLITTLAIVSAVTLIALIVHLLRTDEPVEPNAVTVAAPMAADIPALTERQFGTTQKSPPSAAARSSPSVENTRPSIRRISSACGGIVSRRIWSKNSERGEPPRSSRSAT